MKVLSKNTSLFSLVFLVAHCTSVQPVTTSVTNKKNMHLADPTIFFEGGQYYLYGTVEGSSGNGFKAYSSPNLKDWKLTEKAEGVVLRKEEAFGTAGFWAPQVFKYNKTFYMAYVANENIALAQSDSPAGPFTQRLKDPMAAPVKQIDPYIFIDDDGKKYLYHVRLIEGNKIFVAEMKDDFSAIKPETVRECITATEDWEHTAKTTWKWPVAEGPSVIKHKGTYYLIYTANDFRNPDYAVGYATSSSPLGPWKKYSGNPLINRKILGVNGPGHGDFFRKGKDLLYVLHTHNAAVKVGPRKTALVKLRFVKTKNSIDRLEMEPSSFQFLYQ